MKKFKKVLYLNEFQRDIKKLKKKFVTIEDDLKNFIKSGLGSFHKLNQGDRGIFPISNLGIIYPKIYKARKFACRSLRGTGSFSGIRVIYAYYKDKDEIEFIEIYYKGDKENEDRKRIHKHYSG